MNVSRFIAVISGAGIHSIKDTLKNRLVCGFFMEKKCPEKTLAMLKVCLEALNTAGEKRMKTNRVQE